MCIYFNCVLQCDRPWEKLCLNVLNIFFIIKKILKRGLIIIISNEGQSVGLLYSATDFGFGF